MSVFGRPARNQLDLPLVLVVATIAGLAAATFPPLVTIALTGAILAAVVLIALRDATDWRPASLQVNRVSGLIRERASATAGRDTTLRRWARLAYYAGLLFTGVQILRPVLGVTVSDVFFVLAVVGAVFSVRAREAPHAGYLPPLMLIGASLFIVATLVSTVSAQTPVDSLIQMAKFSFLVFGWFWAGSNLLTTHQHVERATVAWIATAAVNGGAALLQLLAGDDVIPGGLAQWGRMAGLTDHFNDLGAVSAVAFAPALAMVLLTTGGVRLLAVTAAALILVGVLLSGSVAAVVASLVSVVVWAVCSRFQLGPRTAVVLLGGAIMAVWMIGVLESAGALTPLGRLDTAAGEGGTFSTRLETYGEAWWAIGLDPMVGTGLDQGPTPSGYDVHNLFLGTWYQTGLVGISGLLLIIGSVGLIGIAVAAQAVSRRERILALGLLSGFVAFLVVGQSQPFLIQRYAWIPAALLLTVHARHLRRPSKALIPWSVQPDRQPSSDA